MINIKIKNIGPIREIDIELNKINIIMGPQSSGKSTIAKIISQCYWFEKNYILTGDTYHFYRGLIDFHRMDENYFSTSSEIIYESEWMEFKFMSQGNEEVIIKKKRDFSNIFKNLKIEYIPAERNFASTIRNLDRYNESYDNIINFLNDWILFKELLTSNGQFVSPLASINVRYEYDVSEKEDFLVLPNNNRILLQKASSGQQSLTPLLVVCKYLFDDLYNYKRNSSSAERKFIKDSLPEDMKGDYDWIVKNENFEQSTKIQKNIEDIKCKIWEKIGFSPDYNYSNVIIEEPEQNLFPQTQKELIYHLFELVQSKDRNHSILITTHSPYILYAMNNCMLGGLVNEQIKDQGERKDFLENKFPSEKSWIKPKKVSIWEIKDGEIRKIQDKDNIITENYFDLKMTELTNEYYEILNYYKDEE